jgi:CO/xanthine dehydrogenase FAD-binding subunit
MHPICLEPDEIICEVVTPPLPKNFGWGYHKSSRRGGFEYGMAVVAVALSLEASLQTCAEARIVIGAIRERPVRARQAERALIGRPINDALIASTAATAIEEAKPLQHHGFTRSYLIDNIRVYLRRVLVRALERARKHSSTA